MSISVRETAIPSTTKPAVKRKRPLLNELPTFEKTEVKPEYIWFTLNDGRTIAIPIAWSKRLTSATPAQRQNFTLSDYFVFWDDVDEIISMESILFGNKLWL